MAQLLIEEYCKECKTFNLTEEFHLERYEAYCNNCGFETEMIIDDKYLKHDRINCTCGNENADTIESEDKEELLLDSENLKICYCTKCNSNIEFI